MGKQKYNNRSRGFRYLPYAAVSAAKGVYNRFNKAVARSSKAKNSKTYTSTAVGRTKRRGRPGGDMLAGPSQGVLVRNRGVPRFMRTLLKNQAMLRYNGYTSNRLISNVGQQGFAFNPILTRGDTSSFEANDAVAIGKKIFFRRLTVQTQFTNQTNGVVKMKIYTIVPRDDLDSSQTPTSLWTTGLTNIGSTANAALFPGATPFASPLFCQNYLVKKVQTVTLAAGQTYVNRMVAKLNRSFQTDDPVVEHYTKHFTCMQVYVVHGFPVNDSVNKTQISLQATAVDFMSTYQLTYSYFDNGPVTKTYVPSFPPTSFTNAGNVMTFADTNAEATTTA